MGTKQVSSRGGSAAGSASRRRPPPRSGPRRVRCGLGAVAVRWSPRGCSCGHTHAGAPAADQRTPSAGQDGLCRGVSPRGSELPVAAVAEPRESHSRSHSKSVPPPAGRGSGGGLGTGCGLAFSADCWPGCGGTRCFSFVLSALRGVFPPGVRPFRPKALLADVEVLENPNKVISRL